MYNMLTILNHDIVPEIQLFDTSVGFPKSDLRKIPRTPAHGGHTPTTVWHARTLGVVSGFPLRNTDLRLLLAAEVWHWAVVIGIILMAFMQHYCVVMKP